MLCFGSLWSSSNKNRSCSVVEMRDQLSRSDFCHAYDHMLQEVWQMIGNLRSHFFGVLPLSCGSAKSLSCECFHLQLRLNFTISKLWNCKALERLKDNDDEWPIVTRDPHASVLTKLQLPIVQIVVEDEEENTLLYFIAFGAAGRRS